jgi:signal transduction histidine kinase
MISTHWRTVHHPSERDFRLLDILARQAGRCHRARACRGALRDRERQLKDADRRKDEFLATLAHELRNPLAPLRTSLELIRSRATRRTVVEEVREEMEEQLCCSCVWLTICSTCRGSRRGRFGCSARPRNLRRLVTRAVQANRTAIDDKQIDLRIDMPNTRVLIESDPVRFVQVISNVLHNAVKFTDSGRTHQHVR